MFVKGAPHGRAEHSELPFAGQLGMGDAALFLVPVGGIELVGWFGWG